MTLDVREKDYQEKKKICCQTSVVGLAMSDPRTRRVVPKGLRRAFGLFVLIGANLFCLAWGVLVALVKPRYWTAVRFHLRYFKDVMAKEFATKSRNACSTQSP